MIDPKHFRDVLGSYPTGVCVITSNNADGQRWGLAVGTFSSISLDPPLVGFLPDKRSGSWANIATTGRFCVNVLGNAQLETCRRFASRHDDKFEGMAHGTSPGGLPILDGALAWIECAIEKVVELGDHLLVVGAVQAMERAPEGSPLIFYRGGYHRLVDLEDATA
ncbi:MULTISPECIES: flavin reductase family protein [Sphingobium]|uniref:flavin reductase family protein n=1 Tax=Sphingobium TaxID=165695 RepID=UPI0015EB98CC|nr:MULTISPECIES: flavin reductase family protein [Sphingobium]MCW2363718.1 flavin reductase (DIM6/NTAB) family NADH-FMN oxidoreductase RutF [Sphingobium sp. B10D3B]MCW2402884.1 flavin reductase (DIM6/NTAB) family NADH-FMN oxidoreductase RutF [Sphingobium sp. B10D7B]MCW2409862.1 flavin reductase (DIM6/NTAB) family NADH-FMN oxidoreductase RutF [Sphingobium xanthum]